ncbi:MAG: hypothetical protein HRT92_04070 [Piscirickettsiaceae bacterium]|nr:hypothetical protein [Piscirickettsiaceae bacterium]
MNEEITVEYEGKSITAEYSVIEDTLTVYLPDGSMRKTELRGISPRSAASVHIKSYAKLHT